MQAYSPFRGYEFEPQLSRHSLWHLTFSRCDKCHLSSDNGLKVNAEKQPVAWIIRYVVWSPSVRKSGNAWLCETKHQDMTKQLLKNVLNPNQSADLSHIIRFTQMKLRVNPSTQTDNNCLTSRSRKFLKTLWQKKKLLIMSNFSFCHNV